MSRFNRREFILSSLGAIGLLSFGCSPKSNQAPAVAYRPADLPDTPWPEVTENTRQLRSSRVVHEIPQQPVTRTTATTKQPIKPIPKKRYLTLEKVIGRKNWAKGGVSAGLVNPMKSINRITIHHEGSVPVLFSDLNSSRARVEQIRRYHTGERGWADIGYHYIIDRGGRIWEGRRIKYQGAHVKNENENNIGIMVLGNFNQQNPSTAQLSMLPALVKDLRELHKVRVDRVRTHREWNPTSCPGKSLQASIDTMRRRRMFG